MSCRKFAAEYAAQHLRGLTVMANIAEFSGNGSTPIIATHNGSFHCDEAMACGLLRHTKNFRQAVVLRTRDSAQIEPCTAVVDVGTVYDADKFRFDHHQPSFHGTMTTARKTYATRLSSAGLVYKHFGHEIIRSFVEEALASSARETLLTLTGWPSDRHTLLEAEVEVLFDVLYKNFIEQVDGIDNGVEPYGVSDKAGVSLVKNYTQTTTLSDRVGRLQTWWNDPENGNTILENAAFVEAVEMTTREFFDSLSYYAFSWLPARGLVEAAFEQAKEVHPSGKIVVFKDKFCPWKDHLLELEKERGCEGQVLYVLYSDGKGWRVQAVPKENSGFENRKPLPFRGLRGEELSNACGIPGGVFIHVSGFIGGMTSYDGALQLAVRALSEE